MVISAKEALKLQRKVDSPEQIAIELLLKRCDDIIKNSTLQGMTCTSMKIPSILWGCAEYDQSIVRDVIVSKLKSLDFTVTTETSADSHQSDESHYINVSWGSYESRGDEKSDA